MGIRWKVRRWDRGFLASVVPSCFRSREKIMGKHVNTDREVDLGPSPRLPSHEGYVYPDHRLGRHDAGNDLGRVASNGMLYTNSADRDWVGAVLVDD
jgi:hypothetical protein